MDLRKYEKFEVKFAETNKIRNSYHIYMRNKNLWSEENHSL